MSLHLGFLCPDRKVFPEFVVLLCIFHAIKFINALLATAPIIVEKKQKLVDQFKKILYALSENNFEGEDGKFVLMSKDIIVKTGSGEQTKQVPLDDPLDEYYIRNWRSCKEMWVRYYRKHLPRLGDNTSNRVERTFWTLKKSIQDTFMSLPSTVKAVTHFIHFADRHLEEEYVFATNKSTLIYDQDRDIMKLNAQASKVLNDRGCILFHLSLRR